MPGQMELSPWGGERRKRSITRQWVCVCGCVAPAPHGTLIHHTVSETLRCAEQTAAQAPRGWNLQEVCSSLMCKGNWGLREGSRKVGTLGPEQLVFEKLFWDSLVLLWEPMSSSVKWGHSSVPSPGRGKRIYRFETHACLASPTQLHSLTEEEAAAVASSGRASRFRQDWLIVWAPRGKAMVMDAPPGQRG